MAMYAMTALEAMELEDLLRIAAEIDAKITDKGNKRGVIYDILDRQAVQSSETQMGERTRKRARVSVKNNSKEEEAPAKIRPEASATPTTEIKPVETPAEAVAEVGVVAPPKRKRGRPSKAEIAAREEAARLERERAEKERQEPHFEFKEDEEISVEKGNKKEDAVPDFVAEQMAQAEAASAEQGEPVVDADTLRRQMQPSEAATDREVLRSAAKAAKEGKDFIIIKDVPLVLTDTEYENEMAPTAVQRPKFRRFKDDPMIQNNMDNVTVLAQPKVAAPVQQDTNPIQTSGATAAAPVELPQQDELLDACGVLELMSDGFGFLRSGDYNYLASPDDVFVPMNLIRQYGLKAGDVVDGKVKIPRENDKFFMLQRVTTINGLEPAVVRDRVAFEHLTPLFPEEKFQLCTGVNDSMSCRVVDLFSPIGKGQRALIVAQPKTGKTWLMKDIANAIARNHPETYLMMLLIDERPEEVTDMVRTVNAEVIASTFDEPASHHVKIANIVLEKAKRMVECGHDVVIFLDSITRLARAYNTVSPASGKVLTGGVEANSLQYPKRFFGAARKIEGGGSLTIIATALIDTGSKMDEVIFEEFKGTGNMELQLDRNLANKRIYPSVNLVASSTRRDDLLLDKMTQNRMWVLRKFLADMNPVEAMTELSKRMSHTKNNDEFLLSMNG